MYIYIYYYCYILIQHLFIIYNMHDTFPYRQIPSIRYAIVYVNNALCSVRGYGCGQWNLPV